MDSRAHAGRRGVSVPRFELSCKAPDPRRLRIQQVGVVISCWRTRILLTPKVACIPAWTSRRADPWHVSYHVDFFLSIILGHFNLSRTVHNFFLDNPSMGRYTYFAVDLD